MAIQLLFAAKLQILHTLFDQVLAATRPLITFEVDVQHASDDKVILARAESYALDIILLDWSVADATTPALIAKLFRCDANLRVVALLPESVPQYRPKVWHAGACASIPREHMDQEWLASVLCVVHRASAREARLQADNDLLLRRRGLLLRRMMETQEECRRRVARDLHDEASQSLTAALVQVDTLEAILHQSPNQAASHLARLRTTLGHLHDEVQRILLDLRPVLLEQKGLMAALAWYGREGLQAYGVVLQMAGGNCAPDLPDEVKLALYRIGQESLANVARHADARNVVLELRCTGAELVLTLSDDGCGFDVARVTSDIDQLQGVGILGIQERAALLDGTLAVSSVIGQGTTVQVRIPYTGVCRSA